MQHPHGLLVLSAMLKDLECVELVVMATLVEFWGSQHGIVLDCCLLSHSFCHLTTSYIDREFGGSHPGDIGRIPVLDAATSRGETVQSHCGYNATYHS